MLVKLGADSRPQEPAHRGGPVAILWGIETSRALSLLRGRGRSFLDEVGDSRRIGNRHCMGSALYDNGFLRVRPLCHERMYG